MNIGEKKKPKRKEGREKKNIFEILPDEVEEFDDIIQNVIEDLDIAVESIMSYVTQIRIPTAKTPTQEVTVSEVD